MSRRHRFRDMLKKTAIVFDKASSGYLMFENETVQHQTQDRWGNIQVIDHEGQRVLSFDSVYEQSRIDLQCPDMLVHHYTRAMLLGLAFGNPAHVTLLGLGGGCLLRAAHRINPALNLQAVELRPSVLAIAQDYFGLPSAPNIAIEVADGRDYITRQPDASTDLILADMYHAYRADAFQMQKAFFQESHRVLSADGWLVINCHKLPPANGTFFRFLKHYFKDVLICEVPGGNVVVYAAKSGMTKNKALIPLEVNLFEVKTSTNLGFLLEYIAPLG